MNRLLAAALVGVCTCGPATGGSFWESGPASAAKTQVDGFDFAYQVNDGDGVGLVQAFDDGDRTYFQLHRLDRKQVPTVWVVDSDGKKHLARLEAREPYLVVLGTADKFVIQVGRNSSASVNYLGTSARNAKGKVVAQGPAKPGGPSPAERAGGEEVKAEPAVPDVREAKLLNIPFHENSVTPSRRVREEIQALSGTLRNAAWITVKGRPSTGGDTRTATTRALAIQELLVKEGVPPAVIKVSTEHAAKPGKIEGFYLSEIVVADVQAAMGPGFGQAQPLRWEIDPGSSKTVHEALRKWAEVAGWSLSWDLPHDYQIGQKAFFQGNFKEAVAALTESMGQSEKPFEATFYDGNLVVRITPVGGKR